MSRERANSELRLAMKLEEQSRKQDSNLRKAASTQNHLQELNQQKVNQQLQKLQSTLSKQESALKKKEEHKMLSKARKQMTEEFQSKKRIIL